MVEVNDRLVVELSANVDKLLSGMKKASEATGAWGDHAGKTVQSVQASFNGVSFEAAGGKMRAEVLKQIELQHQLDVARTAGDGKMVAALQRQIELMQKIKALRAAGLSATDAPKAAEQQVEALAVAAETAARRREQAERAEKFRGDPGKALEGVFSRSRLGVLEEGGTKIPVFGSALEELGTAGLGAAAGVLAVAEAMEKAKEAAEYAEQVKNLADKLGVTTKDLQEYQFAALASGVSVEALNSSLEQGNKVLGDFQSNIASQKSRKVFDALGITQEEARKAQTITDLLPEIAEKIKDLAPSEQAGIAERLGLSGMLPVLQKGKEGIEELRNEAEASGAVLDTELIRKGAEAAEKLKEAGAEVDGNLKRAFISLAPYVASVLELVAKIAKGIADVIESFGPISQWSRVHIRDAMPDLDRGQATLRGMGVLGAGTVDPKTGYAHGGALSWQYNNIQNDRLKAQGRLKELDEIDAAAKPRARSTGQLVADKDKKEKAAPEDKTAELNKTAIEAEASARKAYLEALAALTTDVQAHADLERQAVDQDLTKTLAQLSKDESDIKRAKVDSQRKEQLALIEKARTEAQNAAAAKKELIDRNAEEALRKQGLDRAAELGTYEERIRTAEASIATSAQRRVDLELQNFRDQQARAYATLEEQLTERRDHAKHDGVEGDYTTDDLTSDLAEARRANAVELVAKRQSLVRSADPLYNLANPTTSVGDDLRDAQAKGVQDLGEGLKDVALRTKTVSAAFHDMAQSIIADLAEIAIKREIEAPLASLLFGQQNPYGNLLATGGQTLIGPISNPSAGTDFGDFAKLAAAVIPHLAGGGPVAGPGGPRGDKIPTMLSDGEYVMPAGASSKYRTLLDAMRSGSLPRLADGGLIGSLTSMTTPRLAAAHGGPMAINVAVDANGAFSYDHVQQAVRGGVLEAVAKARQLVPMDLRSQQARVLP